MEPRELTQGERYFEETGQEPSEAVTGTGSIIFRYTTEFVRWLESRLAEKEKAFGIKEDYVIKLHKENDRLFAEVERLTKEREEMKDVVDAAIQCVGDYKRLKEEVERLSGLYRTACAILKMTYSDSDIEILKNVLMAQKGEVK